MKVLKTLKEYTHTHK